MARVTWKHGNVIAIKLKDGSNAICQMLDSPYLACFDLFPEDDELKDVQLGKAPILFFCAVLRQFLKEAEIRAIKAAPAPITDTPKHWIATFPGSRKVTVWPGTKNELTFIVIHQSPGGKLIHKDIQAKGFAPTPVVMPSIGLDDTETIETHEMNVLWTYPFLNERLYLCRKLGKNVDPDKDIVFGRPLPLEYQDYFKMSAGIGKRADYGYK
jgi:hypothetical protein